MDDAFSSSDQERLVFQAGGLVSTQLTPTITVFQALERLGDGGHVSHQDLDGSVHTASLGRGSR